MSISSPSNAIGIKTVNHLIKVMNSRANGSQVTQSQTQYQTNNGYNYSQTASNKTIPNLWSQTNGNGFQSNQPKLTYGGLLQLLKPNINRQLMQQLLRRDANSKGSINDNIINQQMDIQKQLNAFAEATLGGTMGYQPTNTQYNNQVKDTSSKKLTLSHIMHQIVPQNQRQMERHFTSTSQQLVSKQSLPIANMQPYGKIGSSNYYGERNGINQTEGGTNNKGQTINNQPTLLPLLSQLLIAQLVLLAEHQQQKSTLFAQFSFSIKQFLEVLNIQQSQFGAQVQKFLPNYQMNKKDISIINRSKNDVSPKRMLAAYLNCSVTQLSSQRCLQQLFIPSQIEQGRQSRQLQRVSEKAIGSQRSYYPISSSNMVDSRVGAQLRMTGNFLNVPMRTNHNHGVNGTDQHQSISISVAYKPTGISQQPPSTSNFIKGRNQMQSNHYPNSNNNPMANNHQQFGTVNQLSAVGSRNMPIDKNDRQSNKYTYIENQPTKQNINPTQLSFLDRFIKSSSKLDESIPMGSQRMHALQESSSQSPFQVYETGNAFESTQQKQYGFIDQFQVRSL